MDAAAPEQPESTRSFECAGCGGELFFRDTVIAWWPVHPAWVPGRSDMAFIHLHCAAPLQSFGTKPPQSLEQALSEG